MPGQRGLIKSVAACIKELTSIFHLSLVSQRNYFKWPSEGLTCKNLIIFIGLNFEESTGF
jgi:hypothetical protein